MSDAATRRSTLLVASMSSFLTPFMGSSVNVALPSIGKEFSIDAVLLSWIATAYLLAAAMFLVPFGKIADIHGRKRIFIYGILVDTVASFLCAISFSSESLIAFRFLQGFGDAMIFGTGVAILISVFPAEERGKVLGISVAAVYVGLSCGPFLGGFLTQHLGWRSIFIVIMFLDLLVVAAVPWLKGEWIGTGGEKFDIVGSTIYSLALLAMIYGFSSLPSVEASLLVAMGISGILVFALWELRVRSPVLEIKLLRHNTVFALSNLAALINYSATFAVSFLLSLYLQYIKGFSPQDAGLVLLSQPVVQAIFSPLAGRLSDRLEPRVVSSFGMGVTAIGLSQLIFISRETSLEPIVTTLVLLGFGLAFFSSPNINAVMSSVESKFYGVASATVGTMRLIGQTFSLGITMLIFAFTMGRVQITLPYYSHFIGSMQLAFTIFAGLCFAGIFASLARGKVRLVLK